MQDSWLEKAAWVSVIIVAFLMVRKMLRRGGCGCRSRASMASTPDQNYGRQFGTSTCGFGGKTRGW